MQSRRRGVGLSVVAGAIAATMGLASPTPARAQTVTRICVQTTSTASGIAVQSCQDVSASNPLPVTTTGGASSVTAVQGNAGTNAQAWWVRIGDATNGPVAVKPASTPAAATDPALVVAVRPGDGPLAVTGGASTAAIGYVGGFDIAVPVNPTVQASSYSASNAIGGLQTVSVFRNTGQPSGVLTNLNAGWKSGLLIGVTTYVFDTNPTGSTCTDKAAFVLATADVAKLAFAPISLTPVVPQGATAAVAMQPLSVSVKNQDGAATTNLYVCYVANATVTPGTTTDFFAKISVAQD